MATWILAAIAFVLLIIHLVGRYYKRMAANLVIYQRLPLPYGTRSLPPKEVLSHDEYALYRKCVRMRILCYDIVHVLGTVVVYHLINRLMHLEWFRFVEHMVAFGLFYCVSGVLYFFLFHIPYERHMGRL
jgi:hypothetical protein